MHISLSIYISIYIPGVPFGLYDNSVQYGSWTPSSIRNTVTGSGSNPLQHRRTRQMENMARLFATGSTISCLQ